MRRTKLFATAGVFLALSSLLLGADFWGYQTGVLMLQAGLLALGLGLFLKLNEGSRQSFLLSQLYDLEGWSATTRGSTST